MKLRDIRPRFPGNLRRAIDALRGVAGGDLAALIGTIEAAPASTVIVRAAYGGTRIVDMLVGDPLPRIC